MVDTQRFNLGPGAVGVVSTVARELARRNGQTSVLEVTSYLPLDVDSVARIMDSLEEDEDTTRYQADDGICYFEFDSVDHSSSVDIDSPEFVTRSAAFTKNLASLRNDQDWTRKVREHHELIFRASRSRSPANELTFFTSRCEISRARIQSIFNDFASQGHASVDIKDDDDVSYGIPEFDYPEDRYKRNIGVVEELETQTSFQGAWVAIAIGAALILAIIIALRFL